MTLSSVTVILGFNVGLEFIPAMPHEDIKRSLIIDLAFVRLIFTL